MIASILFCKMTRFALRLLRRGGTDFPGRVALAICPDLLSYLAKDVTTIIVTGTNGKTTTSRMIEQSLADSKISYFANKSGANLLSGVTAEFAMHSSIFGKCRHSFALIEADEAAFKAISPQVQARVIVVTNVFRDQLDRYGEVTHTLSNLRIGCEGSPDALLCLNADDSLCVSLNDALPNKALFYGVDTPIYESRVAELSDAPYCIRCKHAYEYRYVTFGHLGGYRCPVCGYERPAPTVSVTKILSSDEERSRVITRADGRDYETTVNLPGGYNIYNACAAMAAGSALNLNLSTVSSALSTFSCGFGRMEKFSIGKTCLRMILIKNPAGCNQVLNFLTELKTPCIFTACLNDRAQDGKDISWIWDVDFERLAAMGNKLSSVYVSGTRAEDMALRFFYAGIPLEKIHMQKNSERLLETLTSQTLPVYIMPTYTAMLSLRTIISKRYGFSAFWE